MTAGVQGCPQVSLCWLERTVVVYSMDAVAVRVNSYTWRRNVTNPAVALSDPHPDSDAFPLPFIIWHYPYPEIPKVTGELVLHLRKVCRNLKELDLSRCKSVTSASVRRLFDSCPSLKSLNVSFLEGVVEEAFEVCLIMRRFFKSGGWRRGLYSGCQHAWPMCS